MKKLDNKKFVQNAPEKVVQLEQKKKEDAEKKIAALIEKQKDLEAMSN
jgi:valyl-tRNA synthetase